MSVRGRSAIPLTFIPLTMPAWQTSRCSRLIVRKVNCVFGGLLNSELQIRNSEFDVSLLTSAATKKIFFDTNG